MLKEQDLTKILRRIELADEEIVMLKKRIQRLEELFAHVQMKTIP